MRGLGGISVCGQIAIYSEKYISAATYKPEDESVKVEVSDFSGHAEDAVYYLDPERIAAGSVSAMFFVLDALVLCGLVLSLSSGLIAPQIFVFLGSLWSFIISDLLAMAWTLIASGVRTWHGAEHKAIAAYENGTSSLGAIKAASRICSSCSSRIWGVGILLGLVFFITIVLSFSYYLPNGPRPTYYLFILLLLFVWLFLRCVIAIAAAYLRDTLPAILAGCILQKFLTTKEPSEIELKTAQAALLSLIAAENGPDKDDRCSRDPP